VCRPLRFSFASVSQSTLTPRPFVLHTRIVCGSGGGPEKTILNSPRWLTPFGYDALCAYLHPPGDPGFEQLQQKADSLDAPLLGIDDRGPWDLGVVRRLVTLCRERRVTIWHGHDYKSNALGLVVRRFWPMKLVSTVHGWGVEEGRAPLYYKIDRLCLRRYERVICVSESLRETCVRSGVATDRCVVIENAIDTDQYTRRQPALQAKCKLGIPPERLVIGAVGRLSPEKNYAGLIRVLDRVVRQGRDVQLVIVGGGDQQENLEDLVTQLGLIDRVRLLGHRSDTIDLYEAMDVFVLNSLREGLPNVLLEAMALGVPVVATRIGGIPQVVEHDGNGLLIDADSEDQLTAALERLLGDAGLRERLAENARRTIEDRYSFALRMAKVRAIYDGLLGRRK